MNKASLRLLFTFLAMLIMCASYAQNAPPTHKQLKKIRRGKFEYLSGPEKGMIIKRTRHRQYEYDPSLKYKVVAVLKVKWISEDEFLLILIKDPATEGKIAKGFTIKVKITSVSATGDTYSCHTDCDKCGNGLDDSFKRIK